MKTVRNAWQVAAGICAAAIVCASVYEGYASVLPSLPQAQDKSPYTGVIQANTTAESYVPGIWVDPDGCEHWVMDDGLEGFMTPHVRRDGTPVCRRGNMCATMNADQFFASGSARVGADQRESLLRFFRDNPARAYIITGHTDSVASDEFNLRLSLQRANAVARIGASLGANITDVRGYGERQPVASNATSAGRAQNRRVEVICIN
jgi:outer membrane protein OmpA-like peptidoglycan-associated protein